MSDSHLEIRPAPWWLFVLVLAATIFMTELGNQWYGPSGVWKPVDQHTYGLVNQTLIWGLAYFVIVIWGVLLGVGRQRPAQVGIEWRKLPTAGMYTCIVWIVVQVVLVGCYLGVGKEPAIANGWGGVEVLRKAGGLLGQLLGNALCEEIVFRGFLLMQFVWLVRKRWPHQPRTAFLVAFMLATVTFAVMHVPYQLRRHNYASLSAVGWDQIEMLVTGSIFGWLYWQTRNLFFVVGVHALSNEPTTLFAWHDLGPLTRTDPVVFFVGVVIAAAWHRLPATKRKPI